MSTEASTPLAERVDSFVGEVIRPVAAAMASGRGPSPKEIVSAAGEAGLAGMLVPRDLGGAGSTHRDFAALIEAVARTCASSAVILDVHLSVGTEPIVMFGDDAQRRRYLPKLARGEWLAGFALTEPAGGSDAAAVQMRVVRDGDHYVLSGAKAFITGAGVADVYVVVARTGRGADGLSAFIVEAAMPGVGAGAPLHKMGLHGSRTGELILDSVRVPEANRLGAEGMGFTVAMAALDSGRVGISAQATGIAQGALDAATAESRARRARGESVDEVSLANMEAMTVAARLLTRHVAAMVDAGATVTLEASVAKLYSTDACVAVAQQSMDLCAPDSARDGHGTAIRLRDAKACQIYEGTNQIQRIVIARRLLR